MNTAAYTYQLTEIATWRARATNPIFSPAVRAAAAARAARHQQLADQLQSMNQEAMTMTTTPQPTQPPKITATDLMNELIAQRNASRQVNIDLLQKMEAERAALVAGLQGILAEVAQIKMELRAASTPQPAAANQPPDAHGNGVVVFHCDEIVVGWDDKRNEIAYKAKGGRYAGYGVRVWPETLGKFGLEEKDHKTPGERIPIGKDVKAELAEVEVKNKETGEMEKKMVARKVIGLAE